MRQGYAKDEVLAIIADGALLIQVVAEPSQS